MANDEIRLIGINSKGYGNIAKLATQDRRLTIEAKGIYSYFCSYTGAGNNKAFPKVETILRDLCIGKNRYYKHFSLLVKYGYITVEQAVKSGRFSHNIYFVNEKLPCIQNSDTENRDTKFRDSENRDMENEDTNNNSLNNNSLNNNNINKHKINSRKRKTPPEKYENFYL